MLDLDWAVKLLPIIYFVGQISLLIPIWVGYQRRHFLLRHHCVVLWCCIMWAVMTVTAETLRLNGYPNAAVWNLVIILEGVLLGYAFYLVLHSTRTRRFLRVAAVIFLAVGVIDYFYLSGLRTAIYTVSLESTLLIVVALLYFEQALQELRTISLERDEMFLIGVGVVVYFAGTVMIFLLEHIVQDNRNKWILLSINSVLSFALNTTIARAFWLVGREQAADFRSTSANILNRK